MKRNNIIRQLTSIALLLLLVLGSSHKQLLHDIFANHKDCKSNVPRNNLLASFDRQQINCHCDEAVVESPFTPGQSPEVAASPGIYYKIEITHYAFISPGPASEIKLRGPPSAPLS